ncbi:MAG TPA: competence type IV pilus minor pilin ComGG [Tetragenococcus sp.]|nr:competence type IV pilus minor pilin ComGG [Tetragenococcus sp.]
MVNGSSNKTAAGILLTGVVTVVVMSILLLFLVENYQVQARFMYSTREYYEVQLIKELFLTDYLADLPTKKQDSGQVNYNKGTLEYKKEDEKLQLTICVKKQKRNFIVSLPAEKKQEQSTDDSSQQSSFK